MATQNINVVVLTANLTRDPELRNLPSGTSVCKLRVACNTRRKGAGGDWEDKPNYFDVTVFGRHGETCAQYLSKGRPVAIHGRLEWREWQTDGGDKRQAIEIIADTVQFLGGKDDRQEHGSGNGGDQREFTPTTGGGFTPRTETPADDDIPFRWEGPLDYEERRGHTSRW